MKTLRFLTLALVAAVTVLAASSWKCARQREPIVLLETNMGSIKVKLYNETPLHRDNFIKQVKAHSYDSSTFHRVIKDFMIQGGKPKDRNEDDEPALIPAEFRVDQGLYHRKGVLAAARNGDRTNPERASSPFQFYIVWGKVYDDKGLDKMQARVSKATDGKTVFTEEMREVYRTDGGTPWLDGQYTVFGEVIEGMEIVDAIQNVTTDDSDHPLEPVVILSAKLKRK